MPIIRILIPMMITLCLCAAIPTVGANILHISEQQSHYSLAHYLEIYEDRSTSATIDDIASPQFADKFQPVNTNAVSLGLTASAYWLRLTVQGDPADASHRNHWLFSLGRPALTSVDMYAPNPSAPGEWSLHEAGEPKYQHSSHTPNLTPVFVIYPQPSPTTYYVRITNAYSFFFIPKIITDDLYLQQTKHRWLGFGIYYGILLALVLYNFFVFIALREKSYLWYVLYQLSLSQYMLGTNGVTTEWCFPCPLTFMSRILFIFVSCSIIWVSLFSRSFLMTHRYAPAWDAILRGTMFAGLLFIPFALFGDIRWANDGCTLLAFASLIINVIAGIVCLRHGFQPARYFVLAWSLYACSGIIYMLTIRGVLPYTTLGYFGFQVGSAVEAIILSLALADRIRLLQFEREKAQSRAQHYRELAFTDSLTGLYNARHFRTQLTQQIRQAVRQQTPLSLLMMDVDNFKQYNDTYGHPDGDIVLTRISAIIQASVREGDICCRYGGEELAVILPRSNQAQAATIAERIRIAVQDETFVPHTGIPVRITISIGIAEYRHSESEDEIIRRADTALYSAKARGKNLTVCADEQPVIPLPTVTNH